MTDLPLTLTSSLQLNFDALNLRLNALEGKVLFGAGDPEGSIQAKVGTLFLRSDGGAGSTLYVKETGEGDIGWSAK